LDHADVNRLGKSFKSCFLKGGLLMKRLLVMLLVGLLATPAMAAIYQSYFDSPLYTMGQPLVNQDGWVSGGGTGAGTGMVVVNNYSGYNGSGAVVIRQDGTTNQENVDHALNADTPAGVTTVDIDMLPGTGTGGNSWYMWVIDNATGAQSSYWYGGINSAQARIGGSVTAVPGGITSITTLRVVINIAAHSTDYYYDKHDGNGMQFLVTKTGYTGTSADKIRLQAYGRGWTDGTTTAFDNLNPEPASFLLLGLGSLLTLRRRRA